MTVEREPLAWLASVLWPDGSAELGPGAPDELPQWWAAPTAADAHILIPASLRHAPSAVRRYHDGRTGAERLRTVAVELAARIGPIVPRVLGRHPVVLRTHDSGPSVLDGLVDRFGSDAAAVAISLSVPKTNRKPVLQLIDQHGATFGFAKVATNAHTTTLLQNEARWLAKAGSSGLRVPEVLDELTIAGRHVLVTTAIAGGRLPRHRRKRCPVDLARSVAELDAEAPSAAAALGWTERLRQVISHATPSERDVVDMVLARHSEALLRPAAWHGDLTPWNVMRDATGPALIDWEFAADGVPMGFDICHFHLQVATELEDLAPDQALGAAWSRSGPDLERLGVEATVVRPTLDLYALELARRTLALRSAGVDTSNVHQGDAAIRMLAEAADE